MKRFSAIILSTLLILPLFFCITLKLKAASGDYTLLAPLPCVNKSEDCSSGSTETVTDIKSYVEGGFKLLVGISGLIAVLNIIYGGFTYITAEAVGKKANGKKRIQDSLIALVFVIGAWLILNTINPNILSFNLSIDQATIANRFGGGTLSGLNDCPNCLEIPSNLTVKNPGGKLTGGTTQELNLLSNQIPSSLNWVITDAAGMNDSWPLCQSNQTTQCHSSVCHVNGTCVDVRLTNPTATNIKNFAIAASNAGMKATYEVKTDGEKTTLINQGVPASYISVNSDTNGAHFHTVDCTANTCK